MCCDAWVIGDAFAGAGNQSEDHLESDAAYPEMAKSMKLRGMVKVQVIIGTDGTIKETKVIGGHPMLVESVTETLKRWKYAAASTETVTVLEFDFHP